MRGYSPGVRGSSSGGLVQVNPPQQGFLIHLFLLADRSDDVTFD